MEPGGGVGMNRPAVGASVSTERGRVTTTSSGATNEVPLDSSKLRPSIKTNSERECQTFGNK